MSCCNFLAFRENSHLSNIQGSIQSPFKKRIEFLKSEMVKNHNLEKKPTVVISGAGPAGLIRAIQSICNGNPTRIIEKRSEEQEGRQNIVRLEEKTLFILKYFGAYQYLEEKGLISSFLKDDWQAVRLADLESALKAILKELSEEPIITYNTTIEKIIEQEGKISIGLQSTNPKQIENVDLLINTEGYRSTTNVLVGIERTEVLEQIPAITAFYRPQSRLKTCFEFAMTIYYHVLFLFKKATSKKFNQKISACLFFKTPQMGNLSVLFSKKIDDKLNKLQQEKKAREYEALIRYWIHLALCASNFDLFSEKIKNFWSSSYRPQCDWGIHRMNMTFSKVALGADRANNTFKKYGKAAILLAGDALATVDAATGLGCNTAIQSSIDFWELLENLKTNALDSGLDKYSKKMEETILGTHTKSRWARDFYLKAANS